MRPHRANDGLDFDGDVVCGGSAVADAAFADVLDGYRIRAGRRQGAGAVGAELESGPFVGDVSRKSGGAVGGGCRIREKCGKGGGLVAGYAGPEALEASGGRARAIGLDREDLDSLEAILGVSFSRVGKFQEPDLVVFVEAGRELAGEIQLAHNRLRGDLQPHPLRHVRSRHNQRCQHGNDGDDDQQLNEREGGGKG